MFKLRRTRIDIVNLPKEKRAFCPKCNSHQTMKISIYKAGKRRGTARGERRHAERKRGYGLSLIHI